MYDSFFTGIFFQQIYNSTYNWQYTKSERKLKEIEIQEINEADSDNESVENGAKQPTTSSNLYPRLDNEQAMPTLNVSRKPNDKTQKVNFREKVEGEGWLINF